MIIKRCRHCRQRSQRTARSGRGLAEVKGVRRGLDTSPREAGRFSQGVL